MRGRRIRATRAADARCMMRDLQFSRSLNDRYAISGRLDDCGTRRASKIPHETFRRRIARAAFEQECLLANGRIERLIHLAITPRPRTRQSEDLCARDEAERRVAGRDELQGLCDVLAHHPTRLRAAAQML